MHLFLLSSLHPPRTILYQSYESVKVSGPLSLQSSKFCNFACRQNRNKQLFKVFMAWKNSYDSNIILEENFLTPAGESKDVPDDL